VRIQQRVKCENKNARILCEIGLKCEIEKCENDVAVWIYQHFSLGDQLLLLLLLLLL